MAKVAKAVMWSNQKELEKEEKEKAMASKDKAGKAKAISNKVRVTIAARPDTTRGIAEHRKDMVLEFRR